jgi:hypothetical protein
MVFGDSGLEEMFSRGWSELIARDSGPLHGRLVLQPLVATILATRAGWRDARERRRLFFWTLVRDPTERQPLLGQLWKDVGKLFLAAVVLDVVYQIVVLPWVYPVQSLIVATTLAIAPYLVVRGLTNRIVSRMPLRPPPEDKGVPRNDSGDGGEIGSGA